MLCESRHSIRNWRVAGLLDYCANSQLGLKCPWIHSQVIHTLPQLLLCNQWWTWGLFLIRWTSQKFEDVGTCAWLESSFEIQWKLWLVVLAYTGAVIGCSCLVPTWKLWLLVQGAACLDHHLGIFAAEDVFWRQFSASRKLLHKASSLLQLMAMTPGAPAQWAWAVVMVGRSEHHLEKYKGSTIWLFALQVDCYPHYVTSFVTPDGIVLKGC